MDLFDVLYLIGGLCLFLFGMDLMGKSLERRAGHGLTSLLGKLTSGKMKGFLTGLGVTAIIQSSSATTVMVVGFVNSGIMSLRQAINVIMGANVGTTVTSWLLSLTGIEGSNIVLKLLKPTSFTPVLALIGIIMLMVKSNSKRRDTATILLGFATLMFGMDIMGDAVAGLKEVEGFRNILLLFTNPILGVLAGAVLTAIIQSSSASVGILQALSSTGQVSMGAAIPIIMGQNIGTCVTALISSIGTNRNARRASIVHLSFNIIGTVILLCIFCAVKAIFNIDNFTGSAASEFSIAVAHSYFNILCTALLLPASSLLEKLSYKLIPEPKTVVKSEDVIELDERLMATPSIALEQCRILTSTMAQVSVRSLRFSLGQLEKYDPDIATVIREDETCADKYEDILGSYLVKLGTQGLNSTDSMESAKLLHMIGDLERISDHAVNILESVEELHEKGLVFTEQARRELDVLLAALNETIDLSVAAYEQNNIQAAMKVEPLKQIVDILKSRLRSHHIMRLQQGECSIEAGFVWSDLLTNLGRVADHCSNIAGCVIEMSQSKLSLHDYSRAVREGSTEYSDTFDDYSKKYLKSVMM
ncbi:MAG: Na/Pi cotransporter family protein [Oscillospiraceae bacterium]|nr:Na/Pi cotransporter family protein [Oscillospiraceae bacterium]